MIVPIRLSISNAFLIKGERPVLVDTGCPGDAARLQAALAREGVKPADLALILLTHGHRDHAGGVHALKQLTAAPVLIHPADADMIRKGANRPLRPYNLTGRLLRPLVDWRFPTAEPDGYLKEGQDLKAYGLPGRILGTPGHTAGSVSVVLETGDVLAGDLLIGGYLGGLLAPHRPGYPYFFEDLELLKGSVKKLLTCTPKRLYVGHGGPLEASSVAREFGFQADSTNSGRP